MTITYTKDVATSSLGCFLKLLLRWRGSVYKLLWKELIIFIIAYYTLNFVRRFALNEEQQLIFQQISASCESSSNLIPVSFVLGFYVSIVVTRWWKQFILIPRPDKAALFITAFIQGQDERGRLIRRTLIRYMCLSYTIIMSMISPPVKKRFPTNHHFTDAGLMLPNEEHIYESIKTNHPKHFIPLAWATSVVTRARKEGRLRDDMAVKTLIDEINDFRGQLAQIFCYDWISVPLVYTQVTTLATYTYFLACLMGRQYIHSNDGSLVRPDLYVPIFTLLQFLFYMGWLKVAETLNNPFGEDDDDFEINWLIDRNLQVAYLIVDEMHYDFPELLRDAYWDEVNFRLPYTVATENYRKTASYMGSTCEIAIPKNKSEYLPLNAINEDGDDEGELTSADKSLIISGSVRIPSPNESTSTTGSDDTLTHSHTGLHSLSPQSEVFYMDDLATFREENESSPYLTRTLKPNNYCDSDSDSTISVHHSTDTDPFTERDPVRLLDSSIARLVLDEVEAGNETNDGDPVSESTCLL